MSGKILTEKENIENVLGINCNGFHKMGERHLYFNWTPVKVGDELPSGLVLAVNDKKEFLLNYLYEKTQMNETSIVCEGFSSNESIGNVNYYITEEDLVASLPKDKNEM